MEKSGHASAPEGIVSKDPTSPYRSGRTLRWLKTKAFGEAEFYVVGLARDPKGPWVALLARGELDDLRYAGDAIITLSREERDELQRAANFLEVRKPAIRNARKQAQWIRPGLIAKVRHLRGEEKLRHATVIGLRAAQASRYREAARPTRRARYVPKSTCSIPHR